MVDILRIDGRRIDGGRIDGGCIQWAYLTHEAVFHPTCCLLYQEGPDHSEAIYFVS